MVVWILKGSKLLSFKPCNLRTMEEEESRVWHSTKFIKVCALVPPFLFGLFFFFFVCHWRIGLIFLKQIARYICCNFSLSVAVGSDPRRVLFVLPKKKRKKKNWPFLVLCWNFETLSWKSYFCGSLSCGKNGIFSIWVFLYATYGWMYGVCVEK